MTTKPASLRVDVPSAGGLMNARAWMGLVVVAASLFPVAEAGDPFRDPLCVNRDACAGAGSCVQDACVPAPCQPAVHCQGSVEDPQHCVQNSTIEGWTCQPHVLVSARAERTVVAPGVGDESGSHVSVAAQLSNGSVSRQHLVNAWRAPGVEASATLLGIGLGTVAAGAYHSVIEDDGAPGRSWTEVGAGAQLIRGETSREVLVVVWFLDATPDGCYVRPAGADDVHCPRRHELQP